MSSSSPATAATMETIRNQLVAIDEYLTMLVMEMNTTILNADKMTTEDLLNVLTTFKTVAQIGKEIVMPPRPEECSVQLDTCLTLLQRTLCYLEQMDLRPIMVMDVFDSVYDNINRDVADFTVHLADITFS
jgi:hypothetical protein